ncbi:MAG: hypothetical protein J2P55_00105, partial [Rhizobiales bacterium]|nr:hypothetical protein [Hyphomicrobiales bacterium]
GFKVSDLGDVEKFAIRGYGGYRWCPRIKDAGTGWTTATLIEFAGRLYLNGDEDEGTRQMMTLMGEAEWLPLATEA